MIFKDTEKLRSYLTKQKARKSLHAIQREAFPAAKVGTLSRIINDAKYDPANREVRAALKLSLDTCHTCKRKLPKPRKPRATRRVDDFFLDCMTK